MQNVKKAQSILPKGIVYCLLGTGFKFLNIRVKSRQLINFFLKYYTDET